MQTKNGWKKCSRGHNFRGPHCPICWPGKKLVGQRPRVRKQAQARS